MFCLSTHPQIDICIVSTFGCLRNAALNFRVQVSVWTYIFISLGHITRSWISGSCGGGGGFCSVVPDSLQPNSSPPGSSVLHYLLEFTQIHVPRVSDAIQPSLPLPFPLLLPSVFPSIRIFSNWVGSSHQVTLHLIICGIDCWTVFQSHYTILQCQRFTIKKISESNFLSKPKKKKIKPTM